MLEKLSWSTALCLAALITGCGGTTDDEPASPKAPGFEVEDPGPVHVHGLGVNPADGALFVATHTGLFRAAEGEEKARRVADRYQDTMGFTIAGPNRFLGSGHPDGRDRLPPFLGLIRSTDAGRTWTPVSLQGEADFHILEAEGRRVYGFGSDFETRREQLLVSDDGGKRWSARRTPASLIALDVAPDDPQRLIASGDRQLYRSENGGRSWREAEGPAGLLARLGRDLLVAEDTGALSKSTDEGRSWQRVGAIGGQPAAFEGGETLLIALHDGTIKQSDDGKEWTVRARP